MVALGGLALLAAITYFKKWTYLWTEWLTSVDHKKIGVMYIIARPGHAAARLCRRHHDAYPAGHRHRAAAPATCRLNTTTRSSPRTA